jgi:hypothetical protein
LASCELLVAVEIDEISNCSDENHDGHLLVFRLDSEASEKHVERDEEKVPVWVESV